MDTASATCVMWILTVAYLSICVITDIRKQRISTKVSLVFGTAGLFLIFIFIKDEIVFHLLGIVPGIVIMAMSAATRGAVGMGDGILFIVMGIYIGMDENVCILLTALFLCSIISIILLAAKQKGRKDRLPFAPFVMCAVICRLIIGRVLS